MLAALAAPGNASSVHFEGRAARRRIEAARADVALLVGAAPERVTFTSGGSEANATVLSPAPVIDDRQQRIDRLLVAAIEHPSVLAGGRFAADTVEVLPVDATGRLDLDALERRLAASANAGERVLVSLMLANNETGVVQPVAEAARLVHAAGGYLHTDAIQAAGRITIDIEALGADFVTLSSHKIGGPQGAGAVVCRSAAVGFARLIAGGGQERRLRAGTENVAAIAGFGAAASAARAELGRASEWAGWRDGLAAGMRQTAPGLAIYGGDAPRLAQTLCAGVPGVAAETLVIALDLAGVAVSAGSACSSGKVASSHVLAAMSVPAERAREAIRVSFGWETTENDLHTFQLAWREVMSRISGGGSIRAA